MGFAVMLIRAKELGKPFGAWFARRMVVLFAFGMLHMIFLWGGDILHDYAFAGLVLLGWIFLFQTKRLKKFDNPKSFLKIALIWLSIPFVVSSFAALGFGVMLIVVAIIIFQLYFSAWWLKRYQFPQAKYRC